MTRMPAAAGGLASSMLICLSFTAPARPAAARFSRARPSAVPDLSLPWIGRARTALAPRARAGRAAARHLRRIEVRQLLEPERAVEPGRDIERHHRGFDEEGAAAAHGVEERQRRRPSGQLEDAGGEILAQRRFAAGGAPAALEERLARGVEIEGRLVAGQEDVDAHVRRLRVDVRAAAARGAKRVAHRVLDAQRDEIEALHRRPDGGDVDAYRAPHVELPRPGQRARPLRRCRARSRYAACPTCHRMRLAMRLSRLAA